MEVSVRHAVWATQHARSRKCVPLSSFHRTEQGRSSALSRHWLSDTCAGQTATTRAADAHRRSWRWLVAWCVSPLHLRSWYQQMFHSSLKRNDSMIKIIGTNSLSTTRWRFNFLLCTQTVWKRQTVQFVHLQPADQLCLVTVALLTAEGGEGLMSSDPQKALSHSTAETLRRVTSSVFPWSCVLISAGNGSPEGEGLGREDEEADCRANFKTHTSSEKLLRAGHGDESKLSVTYCLLSSEAVRDEIQYTS